MKCPYGRIRFWKPGGKRPVGREQVPDRNPPILPQVADFPIGEQPRRGPREDVAPVELERLAFARIIPRSNGSSMKVCQMRSTADPATKIAHQGSNVISTTDDDPQSAVVRKIMVDPARLVQINARRRHRHHFPPVGLEIGPFTSDAPGAGCMRNLFLPADEIRQCRLKLPDGKAGWISG